MESTRWSRLALLYATTIFLSAFLLFQVQPLISRFILPWFGGGPAVWTTCLLFFQTVLFAGYAYAHASEHFFAPKVRTIVHLALIVAALLTLPITPSDGWKPEDSANPTGRILMLLAVCVGLPYFVLSSTGPLVQAWFSRTIPGRSPYRLYSLSNFGSLLALLSYPFVFEPILSGNGQSLWWTAGFVLFCLLCGTACWLTMTFTRASATAADAEAASPAIANVEALVVASDEAAVATADRPFLLRPVLWLALPAFASALLMATTNHVCEDMPPVPFLCIVPLSLYLLSFIIAFDHERWYRRIPYGLGALLAVYLAVGMSNPPVWGSGWLGDVNRWMSSDPESPWQPTFSYEANLFWQLTALFLLCMVCQGELVRLRPKPRYLTIFYLMISAGGALGGLSVCLVAPKIFDTYAEWKIGLAAGFVLAAIVAILLGEPAGSGLAQPNGERRRWLTLPGGLRMAGFAIALLPLVEIERLLWHDGLSNQTTLARMRSFYGVLTVTDENPDFPALRIHALYNGDTLHGTQFTDPGRKRVPTLYYWAGSGAGLVIDYYLRESQRSGGPLRVGLVGLGVGTLAAYVSEPWHSMRFYEINPQVVEAAENHFSYLSDARERGAKVDVVLGDARLSLEREQKEKPEIFDVLVLDAFSSDSIPIHLLTQEAFEIFLQRVRPDGAIAVHTSNRHLDLVPVVFGLGKHFKLNCVRIQSRDTQQSAQTSGWVVLSRNEQLLQALRTAPSNLQAEAPSPPFPMWTDQWHSLLDVLK